MNNAIPTAIGTPTSIAMNADITVPKNTAAIPNTGGLPCGFQVCVVNRLPVFWVNAGIAFQTRKIAIAAITTSRTAPDPAANALNTRSPTRTDRPDTPASGRPSGSIVPGASTWSAASGTGPPINGLAPGTPWAAISNGSSVRESSPAV